MSGDYNYAANLNNPNLSPGQCEPERVRAGLDTEGTPRGVSPMPDEDLTPAEEFRLTARIVREYADDAGPGWDVYPEDGRITATFRWINLLTPDLGEPLAAAFEAAADEAEQIGADCQLLAVARLIRTKHQVMQGGERS